jgi:peptidoglycan/LPS O-acetylase OafA/YrhL
MSITPLRIAALDILRAFAILMVLLNHVNCGTVPAYYDPSGPAGAIFWAIKKLGWGGVDLFFVLSGFLISGLLFSEVEKTGTIHVPRFLLSRGFKIWPSYYVLLLVLAFAPAVRWIEPGSVAAQLRQIAVHGFFLQNYLDRGVNGPTWSLAIEEHFYMVLPVLFFLSLHLPGLRKKGLHLTPLFAFLFFVGCTALRLFDVFKGGPYRNDFMISHFRFDGLFAGVLLQYLYRNYPERFAVFVRKSWHWLSGLAVLLLLPVVFLGRNHPVMFAIGFTGLIVAYSIIISLAISLDFSRIPRLFFTGALQSIGQWSYSIYLWHFFLPELAGPVYCLPFNAVAAMPLSRPVLMALQILIYFAWSIGVGWLFFTLIETPFMRLRRRVLRRSFGITPAEVRTGPSDNS